MSVLSAKYMHDEAAAFAHVEAMLWADGPVCPHCGVVDSAYKLEGVRTKASKKNPEGKERFGLWKCRECRKQFTVRKGTIFEESHLPLHLWLQAIHLMVSSKKGISSHQLRRVLGITYKSAWFLTHRIRECMRDGALAGFGGDGGVVKVDETFICKEPGVTKAKNARGGSHKMKMLTLVDRKTKHAKSIVVDGRKKSTLIPILQENIAREAYVMTDEASQYQDIGAGRVFDAHGWTNHSAGQYFHRLPTCRFGFATALLGHEASPPFPDNGPRFFRTHFSRVNNVAMRPLSGQVNSVGLSNIQSPRNSS